MGLHLGTAGSGVLRNAVSTSPCPPSVMSTFTSLHREMITKVSTPFLKLIYEILKKNSDWLCSGYELICDPDPSTRRMGGYDWTDPSPGPSL